MLMFVDDTAVIDAHHRQEDAILGHVLVVMINGDAAFTVFTITVTVLTEKAETAHIPEHLFR